MVTIIAAIGLRNELGKNNDLIWKLSEDMQFFKEYTSGKTVIMGKNTYKSIGRPLPKRRNIVVSQTSFDGTESALSLVGAIHMYALTEEAVIIGGSALYSEAMAMADKLLITHICDVDHDADVFFPHIDMTVWKIVAARGSNNGETQYTFVEYARNKTVDK